MHDVFLIKLLREAYRVLGREPAHVSFSTLATLPALAGPGRFAGSVGCAERRVGLLIGSRCRHEIEVVRGVAGTP